MKYSFFLFFFFNFVGLDSHTFFVFSKKKKKLNFFFNGAIRESDVCLLDHPLHMDFLYPKLKIY